MTIKESHSLSAGICDEAGRQAVTMQLGYGEKHLNLYAEIVDEQYVAAHAQAVRADVAAFLDVAFARAAEAFAALPSAAEGGA